MIGVKKIKIICMVLSVIFLSACADNHESIGSNSLTLKDSRTAAQWFQQGKDNVQQRKLTLEARQKNNPYNSTSRDSKAKNIIFLLGDGMGVSTLTAARIFVGQQQGLLGEEFALSFERFPYSALIKTYNVDLQTPDSAGTMSALMTGVKTNEGIISLPETAQRGDCSSMSQSKIPTFIDLAKAKGKATAMVTTARVTHATPATTYAHSVDRNWESDEAIPDREKMIGCTDIASQFITNQAHSLDILMGGGRRHFLPKEDGGKRADHRNLIEEWQKKGEYVSTAQELKMLQKHDKVIPLLGLFAMSHMEYAHQRPPEQPSLQQMTASALTQLQKSEQGYALVIEAGRIDHGHHDGIAYKALTETQELHETVAWLLTQVDLSETLIIVTADHSHTLTLAGYATRGHSILANVVGNDAQGYPEQTPSLDLMGNPYTTLGYRDGPGAHQEEHDLAKTQIEKHIKTHAPDYRQAALVPMDYETHGGEDVALYAIGPHAQLFSGTLEQHWVYHALKYVM